MLKRRNVFRVGLFYVVATWLVIEVAETVLPLFGRRPPLRPNFVVRRHPGGSHAGG